MPSTLNISERRCASPEAIQALETLASCSLPDLWKLLDLVMRERFGAGMLARDVHDEHAKDLICCLRRDLDELSRLPPG